jgi:antitoxin component YwqK of YwqJK toxin-antitoxin module
MEKRVNQKDEQGRHHGVWERYRTDGTLHGRVHYHHGREHGVWEHYFIDGTPRWRRHYHHGMLKGLAKWWDRVGKASCKIYHLDIK